eukprot:242530-Prorocentrum_minimum.AAC.5
MAMATWKRVFEGEAHVPDELHRAPERRSAQTKWPIRSASHWGSCFKRESLFTLASSVSGW